MLVTLEDRKKRFWRGTSLSIGAPLGNLEGGSSTRDFDIWLKGALEVEHLSMCNLCEGNLEGGLHCWRP